MAKKYKSQGKQASLMLLEEGGQKYIQKVYAQGKGLTLEEAEEILHYHKQYINDLTKLSFETNIPESVSINKSENEYHLVTLERYRGEGYDIHEHLLDAKTASELLSLVKKYYPVLLENLFSIPPYDSDVYTLSSVFVSVPMDYRPCNFVIENMGSSFKAVNVDTFAPRIWRKKGEILYLPKIEDGFPAVKAQLLHLLMGDIRYMYGRIYGIVMLIATQWAKNYFSNIEDIENLRHKTAGLISVICTDTLNKSSAFDAQMKDLLCDDIRSVLLKTTTMGPYEGTQIIQDFWQNLDKGVLRDFK